jgi:hypothetical protein
MRIRSPRRHRSIPIAPCLAAGFFACFACDAHDATSATPEAAPPLPSAAAAPPAPPPPEVRAPDIIVDPSYVSIGNDKVPTLGGTEGALADRIGVFVSGHPTVESISGRTIDVVAMRNARPSQVAATLSALRHAGASAAAVKTEARDNSTQRLPLAFTVPVQPCTTVAWIGKDAAIDVWPISGGRAKKVIKGLAGPDMTLGTEAVRSVAGGCDASALVVGADDSMTWGLVFDLATMALAAPGARVSGAVLVTSAVPGRKLALDAKAQ